MSPDSTPTSVPTSDPIPHVVPPPPRPADDTITIGRGTLNAIIAGVVCLVFGIAIGLLLADRLAPRGGSLDSGAMVDAVGTAIALARPTPRATADPNARYDVSDAGDPVLGSDDAPITMIEFGDFTCPYCHQFYDTTLRPLLAQYGDQVRFVFRDFPTVSGYSEIAAIGGECADDQGRFWELHDLMFEYSRSLGRTTLIQLATALDLDVEAFTACLDTNPHADEIEDDLDTAVALGITGPPTFFINGRMIVGAQSSLVFRRVIDEELARINGTEATPEAPGV